MTRLDRMSSQDRSPVLLLDELSASPKVALGQNEVGETTPGREFGDVTASPLPAKKQLAGATVAVRSERRLEPLRQDVMPFGAFLGNDRLNGDPSAILVTLRTRLHEREEEITARRGRYSESVWPHIATV